MRILYDWFKYYRLRKRNIEYADLVAWRVQNLSERTL